MAKKEKGLIAKLLPTVIACMLLGVGLVWLIVGLVISLISNFAPGVFKPIFWIFAGVLFLAGLVLLIISLVKNK